MVKEYLAKVIKNQSMESGFSVLQLEAKELSRTVQSGQFVALASEVDTKLSRRPISVHAVNLEEGQIELLIRNVGKNTAAYCAKQPGKFLKILGPLGNPARINPLKKTFAFIAGGCGVAPMPLLIQGILNQSQDVKIIVAGGFKTLQETYILNQFIHLPVTLVSATEDGSSSFKGTAVDLFKWMVPKLRLDTITPAEEIDCVYACGPRPMLRAVAEICKQANVECNVIVEEMMLCGGIGACLSCAIPKADGTGNYHVCTDGPVFNTQEIVL